MDYRHDHKIKNCKTSTEKGKKIHRTLDLAIFRHYTRSTMIERKVCNLKMMKNTNFCSEKDNINEKTKQVWWDMLIILALWEAGVAGSQVLDKPGQFSN